VKRGEKGRQFRFLSLSVYRYSPHPRGTLRSTGRRIWPYRLPKSSHGVAGVEREEGHRLADTRRKPSNKRYLSRLRRLTDGIDDVHFQQISQDTTSAHIFPQAGRSDRDVALPYTNNPLAFGILATVHSTAKQTWAAKHPRRWYNHTRGTAAIRVNGVDHSASRAKGKHCEPKRPRCGELGNVPEQARATKALEIDEVTTTERRYINLAINKPKSSVHSHDFAPSTWKGGEPTPSGNRTTYLRLIPPQIRDCDGTPPRRPTLGRRLMKIHIPQISCSNRWAAKSKISAPRRPQGTGGLHAAREQ